MHQIAIKIQFSVVFAEFIETQMHGVRTCIMTSDKKDVTLTFLHLLTLAPHPPLIL